MQMDNIKALITPLTLYYTSSKPYSILLKLKRILISTGYELQKFECKKQSQLKNNMAEFSTSSIVSTFSFKLSKELQLANTKVEIMVFGFLNKDIKLLGVATLDLGLFQHIQSKDLPVFKQLKIKLQKCQDINAYIIARLQIDKSGNENEGVNKKVKQFGGNSIVTESDKKQTLIAGRRKQYNMPSAYQISRKNYKNVEITRNAEDRSTSRNRNDSSGSYRKRFQYQYSRQTHRENGRQEDSPQQPPQKKPQRREQKGSPMPRVKTPRPITEYEPKKQNENEDRNESVGSSYSKQKERQTDNKWANQDGYFKNTQKKSKNKIKVIVDVYQEKRVIEVQGSDFGIHDDRVLGNLEKREIGQDDEESQIKQTGRFAHIEKNQYDVHQPGRISQQNISNGNKMSPTRNDQLKKQHKYNNIDQHNEQNNKNQGSQLSQKPLSNSQNYNKYREQQSQQIKQSKIVNKESNKQANSSIYENKVKKAGELRSQNDSNQKQSTESANKYKSITDKLQQIQHKIKQKRKSESPVGPTAEQISSQNTFGYNQEDDDYEHQPRKPFSPYKTKQKKQISAKDKGQTQTGKVDKFSVNTFKEHQFNSVQQISPGNKSQTTGHVDSFNYMSQSLVQVKDEELDPIGQQNGNVHSDSTINIINNSPWYSKSQKSGKKQQKNQQKINFKKEDQKYKQNTQKVQKPIKKQMESSQPRSSNNKNNFENSVANFSINEKDIASQKKDMKQNQNKKKQNEANFEIKRPEQPKPNIKEQKKDPKIYQKIEASPQKKQNKLQNSSKIIKKNVVAESNNQSNKSEQKNTQKKQIKTLKPSNEVSLTIVATENKEQKQKQSLKQSKQKQLNQKQLHKNCDQRITELQNLLDHQQQAFRKQLMEKQLQIKKSTKKQEGKSCKIHEEQIDKLKEENRMLKQKYKEMQNREQKSVNSIQSKDSKQNIGNSQELNKLKDQNVKLRNLVEKLNSELEQVDEKHFQALTVAEKKDLEYQRKMDVLIKKNNQLLSQIQNMDKQNKEQADKIKKLSSLPLPENPASSKNLSSGVQSQKTIKANAGSGEKTYQEQYLAEKKKSVNLEAQLREKNNEIKFLKIKNENLLQEKKDLQNQIDNIAINNKLEMAKQGSISKMNLQSASVANSVKVQNKVLKDEICSLQRQVHELNGLLQGIIIEGNAQNERISSNKEVSQREHIQNLQKKYKALQKKTEAYEQQIKQKQMKIAQIINVIFSHGNPKLMDQISTLVGMS